MAQENNPQVHDIICINIYFFLLHQLGPLGQKMLVQLSKSKEKFISLPGHHVPKFITIMLDEIKEISELKPNTPSMRQEMLKARSAFCVNKWQPVPSPP